MTTVFEVATVEQAVVLIQDLSDKVGCNKTRAGVIGHSYPAAGAAVSMASNYKSHPGHQRDIVCDDYEQISTEVGYLTVKAFRTSRWREATLRERLHLLILITNGLPSDLKQRILKAVA